MKTIKFTKSEIEMLKVIFSKHANDAKGFQNCYDIYESAEYIFDKTPEAVCKIERSIADKIHS